MENEDEILNNLVGEVEILSRNLNQNKNEEV